ncbi:MAG: protein kinase [Planctomycetota bacterium]|nr:protein kinase [Planctomycetota bacterium]
MDRDRLIEQIFLAVVEAPREEWPRVLAEQCAGDDTLRAEVESLLSHHDAADEKFLDAAELHPGAGGAGAGGGELAMALPPGTRIGEFTLLGVLGEGGMGVVYLAQQERPKRTVALKLIRTSSPAVLRRFELEAEILARLEHPGIAQIYAAGIADVDESAVRQPYIAMEYVDGALLSQFAAERKLTVREKLGLMIQVCEAVQHAHQRGIIHRDIKPANILVKESQTGEVGSGTGLTGTESPWATPAWQVKVLDFGVARSLAGEEGTILTGAGQLLGTLPYMSPEQVRGGEESADTRTDVYALGVTLFQLLCGKLPLDVEGRNVIEASRIIGDATPRRLREVDRTLRGELDTIVWKAMEKARERRYQSVADLAEDLRRFLDGRPILAKQDSALYVVGKQVRRHKHLVFSAVIALIGLVAFAAYAWTLANEERRARVEAVESQKRAQAAQERADEERVIATEQRALAEAQRKVADQRAEELRRSLYLSAMGHAHAAILSNDVERAKAVLKECPEDLRGWEWKYLSTETDQSVRTTSVGRADVRLNRSGTIGLLLTRGGFQIIDLATGSTKPVEREGVLALGASNDGRWIAAVGSKGWEVMDREGVTRASGALEGDAPLVFPVGLSSNGSRLAVNARRGYLTMIDVQTGRTLWSAGEPDRLISCVFSPDDRLVAAGWRDGPVEIFDTETGERVHLLIGHEILCRGLAFSPDSKRIATGGDDNVIRVWDLSTGKARVLRPHANKVATLCWAPDGEHLLSSGTEAMIQVTHIESERVVSSLRGHDAVVLALAMTPDAKHVYTVANDGTLRAWDGDAALRGHGFRLPIVFVESGDVSRDGSLLLGGGNREVAVSDWTKMLARIETPARVSRVVLDGPLDPSATGDGDAGSGVSGLKILPPTTAAIGLDSGEVLLCDARTLEVRSTFKVPAGAAGALAFDPLGRYLAAGSQHKSVVLVDPKTGLTIQELQNENAGCSALAFSADGSLLASGTGNGGIHLYDAKSRTRLGTYEGMKFWIASVAISHNKQYLAASDARSELGVWNIGDPKSMRLLRGQRFATMSIAFMPDDERLVTGGFDNTVRLWDWRSGQNLLTLRWHNYGVPFVGTSMDGKRAFSASRYGHFRAWETERVGGVQIPVPGATARMQ